MNKVILMGRLVKDPEVRYSQVGEPIAVARYTLAVNRRTKKNGETEADFINCVAFGKSGEFAEKYFKKGQMVAIVGRMQVRSWDKDGERRWSTEVVVEEQYFAESKKENGESKPAEQNRPTATPNRPAKQMGLAEQEGFYPSEPQVAAPEGWFAEQTSGDESIEDDNLPF